jgi:hypothetical protein
MEGYRGREGEREREIISGSPRDADYPVHKTSLHNSQLTPHPHTHLRHSRRWTVVDLSLRLRKGFGRWGFFRRIRCGVAGLHRERSHIVRESLWCVSAREQDTENENKKVRVLRAHPHTRESRERERARGCVCALFCAFRRNLICSIEVRDVQANLTLARPLETLFTTHTHTHWKPITV